MTDAPWTLGLLKARNMQIHALCENAQCGRISIADTDILITHFGPDKLVSDFDGVRCEACGGALKIMIGFNDPDDRPEDLGGGNGYDLAPDAKDEGGR